MRAWPGVIGSGVVLLLGACGPGRAQGEGGGGGESESGSLETLDTLDPADSTDSTDPTDPTDSGSSSDGPDDCGPEQLLCPNGSCRPLGEWPCCMAGGECPLCEPGQLLCPDLSCQPEAPWGCCEYGGDCPAPGCEAQDAQTGPDACISDPVYAWDGAGCYAVIECACVGEDCPNLPAEPLACLSAKADCLFAPFEDCPYALAMVDIEGTILGQPWVASHAAFAEIKGEGSTLLELALADDELSLVNYAFAHQVGPRLVNVSFLEGLGVIDAYARIGDGFNPPQTAPASVTITDLELAAPSFAERFVIGSLDVVAEGWDLHGEFTIYGCQALYQVLP